MKPDITSKKDLKIIITNFYDLLLNDVKMLPFFKEIVALNHLENHIDVIADFWNDILFDTNTYANNVMQKHIDKNALIEFEKQHFTIWISYLFQSIDALFDGENVVKMKTRATSIATIMQLKMNLYKK